MTNSHYIIKTMNRLFLLLFFASFSLFSHAITAMVDNLLFEIHFETKQVKVVGFRSSTPYAVIPASINIRGKSYRVTSIGHDAFSGHKNLSSVVIPNSVTSIEYNAFWYCTALTSITIPNSVTRIGNQAFHSCSRLTSVTLPNSVTEFGCSVFSNCTSLTSIKFPQGISSIPEYTCNGCKSLTSVTIPNSVTSIGERAFYGCESLTSLTIPENVSELFSCAFKGCIALKSVIFLCPTPPKGYIPCFCAKHATICVPAGAKEAYLSFGGDDFSINEYSWVLQSFEYIREFK